MKKKVLFVASIFLATATFAQDGLTSKKGEAYLPEAGDWAIGFDGTPFLEYGGNMFNGTQNNSVNATWVGNNPAMTLVGKYFVDENTAYRGKLRIGFGSTSSDALIDTNATGFGDPVYITNESSTSNFNLTLGGGIEKRKGNTRIQGFYGGEILINIASSSTEEDYGIALSDNFDNAGASRTTETSAGSTFGLGLRAFAGVEWFISPKVSVSAEYGWGLAISSTGEGEMTSERWGLASSTATDNSLITTETTTGGNSSFGIDTDNNGGVITIMFHF